MIVHCIAGLPWILLSEKQDYKIVRCPVTGNTHSMAAFLFSR